MFSNPEDFFVSGSLSPFPFPLKALNLRSPDNITEILAHLTVTFCLHVNKSIFSSEFRNFRYELSEHLLVMAALCNRAGHYIFALWFLSSFVFFFSSPNLSGRRLNVYHTSTHGVALVRI